MHPATVGWHADPYGRHKERFFDGQKWSPYVRDGDVNGVDEPGGPVVDAATKSRIGLLSEDVLVVERFTDLRRRWSDRTVQRGDGTGPACSGVRTPSPASSPPSARWWSGTTRGTTSSSSSTTTVRWCSP